MNSNYYSYDSVLDPLPETDRLLANLFAFFVKLFDFFNVALKKYGFTTKSDGE